MVYRIHFEMEINIYDGNSFDLLCTRLQNGGLAHCLYLKTNTYQDAN